MPNNTNLFFIAAIATMLLLARPETPSDARLTQVSEFADTPLPNMDSPVVYQGPELEVYNRQKIALDRSLAEARRENLHIKKQQARIDGQIDTLIAATGMLVIETDTALYTMMPPTHSWFRKLWRKLKK